jgi:hypothetical protein
MGEMRNAYDILAGKPVGKSPLGRPTCRREDNIRMERREEGVDWIHLGQDRDQWWTLVNTVMGLLFP